jgi:hypothetical protein
MHAISNIHLFLTKDETEMLTELKHLHCSYCHLVVSSVTASNSSDVYNIGGGIRTLEQAVGSCIYVLYFIFFLSFSNLFSSPPFLLHFFLFSTVTKQPSSGSPNGLLVALALMLPSLYHALFSSAWVTLPLFKTEVAASSEMLVPIYQNTWFHIPEDHNIVT